MLRRLKHRHTLRQSSQSSRVEPVAEEGNGRWRPTVGAEAFGFLEHSVPEAARESVSEAAAAILGKGIAPTAQGGQETGLVVGYVQSGKTMSFETVAALARDNRFQIVIVVTGTSNPLLNQSTGRLRRDLRLDDENRERRWIHFKNPDDDMPRLHPFATCLMNGAIQERPMKTRGQFSSPS
jgi:hypothetical protein